MPGQVVELLQDSGVAAISIHGRTMEQRYKRVADWDLISTAARSSSIPVVGNGDILTHYEVTSSYCFPPSLSSCLLLRLLSVALLVLNGFWKWKEMQRCQVHRSGGQR